MIKHYKAVRRDMKLRIRISKSEYEQIQAYAKALSISSLSEYIRRVLFDFSKQRGEELVLFNLESGVHGGREKVKISAFQYKMIQELNKIGVNVNQIAHAINSHRASGKPVFPEDVRQQLNKELPEVKNLLNELVNRITKEG